MSIGIRELLRAVMTTTSNEGFLMNKMSFVHLFEMVMIFYFHSRGIFNKGKKWRLDYSSGEGDDFLFNYRANNRGQNNQEFKMKMDLPSFDSRLHI